MENKNIIIILLLIVVILALGVGVMFQQQTPAKEPSEIKITSNNTQYEGGKVSLQLTDSNKTAISNEKVNVTVQNAKGKVVVNKTVKTDSKGHANLNLDLKKGKYSVNVTYGGNENYTENSISQNLTVKEKVKPAASEQSDSSSSDLGGYDRYSPQYGTYIRQYTDSNGIQHIEGANGIHESYDPSTGILTSDDGKGHVDKARMC